MKKIILFVLIITVVFVFSACNDKDSTSDVPSTTLNTLDVGSGEVTYDESVIKDLLSVYDLGLSSSIYSYTFKMTTETQMEKEGIRAEAYLGDAQTPEAVFFIVGTQCYIYNDKTDSYDFLTLDGVISLSPSTEAPTGKEDDTTLTETTTSVDDYNKSTIQSRYKDYDLSVVNLTKDISEYDFQVTGDFDVASNGVTVYKIYVLDNGTYVDAIFGVGTDGKDYYYDSLKDDFLELS